MPGVGADHGTISYLRGSASLVPAMTVGGVGLFAAAATYLVGAAIAYRRANRGRPRPGTIGTVTAEPLHAASLVDLAARRLQAEILSGELAPGERIVEEQLTRRFGTSRAPLREALRLLGQQGLVEHLPRRGVRVTRLSARDIDELFTLRDALEQFAVRCAAARPADETGLDAMAAAVEAMECATAAGDTVAQDAAHRAFHLALVARSGHRHLIDVYEPVILKLQLYMATNMRREAVQRPSAEGPLRHRRLYEAVRGGDPATIVDALAHHGARTYLAPELDGG